MKKRFWFIASLSLFLLLILMGIPLFTEQGEVKQGETEKDIVDVLLEKYDFPKQEDIPNVLTVGEGKRFSSVQTAVNNAQDGDVIVVFSGIYEEAVTVLDKTISIIGQSKEDCCITYPNGNYMEPPLEMGSGFLANITVHATRQTKLPNAVAKAYALHTDFGISANNSLEIVDVNFLNDDYQTVGIGLRQNFTLRFQNCLFECKADQSAFYCHDDPIQKESVGQRLIVENCRFLNSGQRSTILLQSQEEEGSSIECEWVSNVVENKGSSNLFSVYLWKEKSASSAGWQNMSFWNNSPNSKQNSLELLNAAE